VDFRSDIFAIGVLAYEMFAGRHPFRRATMVETQAALIREPAPALDDNHPLVPSGTVDVIFRCLEKDPGDRFGSVEELSDVLGCCENGS
jgi:serine/threonine protein kinase